MNMLLIKGNQSYLMNYGKDLGENTLPEQKV